MSPPGRSGRTAPTEHEEALDGLTETGQVTAERFTAENGNDGLRYAFAGGAR